MSNPKRHTPPPLLLEQWLLGELPEARLVALRKEFGSEALEAAREALAREDAATRERLPALKRPWTPLLDPEDGRGKRRHLLNMLSLPALGAALAATALVVVGGDLGEPSRPDANPTHEAAGPGTETRTKGLAPQLLVFRKRGEVVEPLADGGHSHEGDVLQLAYVAAGQAHGVIASVDGHGTVTVHFPELPNATTDLKPGQVLLGHAYQLDDAPRFEHFLFITSQTAIDVTAVERALSEAARRTAASGKPPSIPEPFASYKVAHITLYKD